MKKLNLSIIVLTILALLTLSFMNHNEEMYFRAMGEVEPEVIVKGSVVEMEPILEPLVNLKTFLVYKDSIGFKESRNNYNAINKYGYLGKYQFGKSALKDLGLNNVSKSDFLKNHDLQERAFEALLSINKYRLRKYLKHEGKTINGIKVTESGMLAASHLVGANSVKKWLRSNGKKNRADANGTTVEHYMKKFADYDTRNIEQKRRIKLK